MKTMKNNKQILQFKKNHTDMKPLLQNHQYRRVALIITVTCIRVTHCHFLICNDLILFYIRLSDNYIMANSF